MFDVLWDEGGEKIGERRARKEGEREQKRTEERRSVRDSISSRSSLSSVDRAQGFLGGLGLKISNASLRGRRHASNTADDGNSKRASILGHFVAAPPAISPHSFPVHLEERHTSPPLTMSESQTTGSAAPSETSANRSSKGSVVSKSTTATAMTIPSQAKKESRGDSGGKASMCTQEQKAGIIGTTTAKTAYEHQPNDMKIEVSAKKQDKERRASFSAPHTPSRFLLPPQPLLQPSHTTPCRPKHPKPAPSRLVSSLPMALLDNNSHSPPATPDSDAVNSLLIDKWFTSVSGPSGLSPSPTSRVDAINDKQPDVSLNMKPPSLMANHGTQSPSQKSTKPSMMFRANNSVVWKSSDEWRQSAANTEKSAQASSRLAEPPLILPAPAAIQPSAAQSAAPQKRGAAYDPMTLDLTAVQREVAKMAIASPEIVILRLNENWGTSTDASFYRELEMEKKRWMISAIRTIERGSQGTVSPRRSKAEDEDRHILALFESQAMASYLAAVNPQARITHLSPKPLPKILFPNVHPLPLAVSGLLPLATNKYNEVHCMSLPSIMPSQEIPRLLRRVHRSLIPKGVLHLTVIDPAPSSPSLGPVMRQWLDENLMLNLETRFRCISPSRLLPAWLADARLRADGSVISKVKFDAVYKPKPEGDDATSEGGRENIEAELRSAVGRKLWQEVWGNFVHGSNWWWDDPACVEECARLGTFFEYSLIEAVKDTV